MNYYNVYFSTKGLHEMATTGYVRHKLAHLVHIPFLGLFLATTRLASFRGGRTRICGRF